MVDLVTLYFVLKPHLKSVLTQPTRVEPKIFLRTFYMEFDVSTLLLHPEFPMSFSHTRSGSRFNAIIN